MRTTAIRIAVLGLAGLCATASAARADAIYTFNSLTSTNNGANPAVTGTLPLTVTLDITDAAAQTGRFALNGTGTGSAPVFTSAGSPVAPTGLVSLSIATGSTLASISPTSLNGSINLSLSFSATGLVSSTLLSFTGPTNSALLTGTGVNANGSVGEITSPCATTASSGVCAVSGTWATSSSSTAVPEPATMALLGLPLLALVELRRNRSRGAGA